METDFRQLPSVDRILSDERIQALSGNYPHELMVTFAREQLQQARTIIAHGKKALSPDTIAGAVVKAVLELERPVITRVINASGIILHTNLGRAPMSSDAIRAMDDVSRGYSDLEFNLATGKRGSRHSHIEGLVCRLTGAEAALVVNNNASGVLLGLSALAKRKEVIVSRGEAVEIGGSFRIPDVMRQSGAKLIEIGTTNCTYVNDYEQAITERTAALMKVHSSNFKVIGFTAGITIQELNELGKRTGLPVLDDLGSGCFIDTSPFGLDHEPTVQETIAAGTGLAFFSGDKLVGGPQAGIIVGKKDLVDKLKKHPLARAVRIDKTRIAGLAATLVHFLKGEATEKIPIWRMISAPIEEIDRRAHVWADAFGSSAEVIGSETMIGGGSLPGTSLPTRVVSIRYAKDNGSMVQKLSVRLRTHPVNPMLGRISEDSYILDPRSVLPEEDETVTGLLKELSAG